MPGRKKPALGAATRTPRPSSSLCTTSWATTSRPWSRWGLRPGRSGSVSHGVRGLDGPLPSLSGMRCAHLHASEPPLLLGRTHDSSRISTRCGTCRPSARSACRAPSCGWATAGATAPSPSGVPCWTSWSTTSATVSRRPGFRVHGIPQSGKV